MNKVGKLGKRNRNAGNHKSYLARSMDKSQILAKRRYDTEYQKTRVTDRVKRNTARRQFIKAGKVSVGDGKDIDHIKPIKKGGSNSRTNLRVLSKSKNRAKKY